MKYIKNRDDFKRILEAQSVPTDQIYDGTWEDTLIGKLVSFLGRKIVQRYKKGKLNNLLKQLQRELENVQFRTLQENKIVQEYSVYENIVIIKSYLYGNKGDFDKEVLESMIEDAIDYHTNESDNQELPEPIRQKHENVAKGFEELLEYSSEIEESLNEALSQDALKEGYLEPGEIIANFMEIPFSKLLSNPSLGDMRLSNLKLTGNQKGYEKYKEALKEVFKKMYKSLTEVLPMIKDVATKKKVNDLVNMISSISYDDYSSLANDFDKNIKPLASEIIDMYDEEMRKLSRKEPSDNQHVKAAIDKALQNEDVIYVRWMNETKKKAIEGVAPKSILSKSDLLKNGKIDQEVWENLVDEKEIQFTAFVFGKDNKVKKSISIAPKDASRIVQLGDNKIEGVLQDTSEYQQKMIDKINEIFPNDEEYRETITISNEELKELSEKMNAKVEDQMNVVDPIAIIRIFKRAFDAYSITKEEYDALSERYSPKVAAKKKRRYEVIGNSARDKKLFREWYDGVMQILQQYGDILRGKVEESKIFEQKVDNASINKAILKFIIDLLDNNQMFASGSKQGLQSELLKKYFDIDLEDQRDILATSGGSYKTKKAKSEKIIPEFSDDNDAMFKEVSEIQLLKDNFEDVPFAIKSGNNYYIFKWISLVNGRIIAKYKTNNFDFLKNYDPKVDIKQGDMEIKGERGENVRYAVFRRPKGLNHSLTKGDKIMIVTSEDLEKASDVDKFSDKVTIKIDSLYILMGEDGEGMKKLDEMKPPFEYGDKYIDDLSRVENQLREVI